MYNPQLEAAEVYMASIVLAYFVYMAIFWTWMTHSFLIQFSFICTAPFYNKIVSRGFTESETQSQNPKVSAVARKNSLLT